MDMNWLVHTRENACMMVLGSERLQNAVQQEEVHTMPIVNFNLQDLLLAPLNLPTVSCRKLVAPKYGQVWLSGDSYSSTAYYRCNYGYDLHGSHSRKCQHDGTWYGKAPECRVARRSKYMLHLSPCQQLAVNLTFLFIFVVSCRRLDAPKYGKVIVTGQSYSSRAYYSCDYGYELDGAYSRKCQHDGTWYGKAPECRPSKRGK